MPQAFESRGKGVISAVTATGFEPFSFGTAAEVGSHSFTHALTVLLGTLSVPRHRSARIEPFSDILLHQVLATEMKKVPMALKRNNDGTFKRDGAGNHEIEPYRRRCPMYQFLSRNRSARPIDICPLSVTENVDCREEPQPSDNTYQPRLLSEGTPIPEVLISLRLMPDSIDDLDVNAWTRLMLSLPECVSEVAITGHEVKIDSLHRSYSTLVLLRIPLHTWSLLKKDKSMTFIGFTFGGNQAEQLNKRVAKQMMALSSATLDTPPVTETAKNATIIDPRKQTTRSIDSEKQKHSRQESHPPVMTEGAKSEMKNTSRRVLRSSTIKEDPKWAQGLQPRARIESRAINRHGPRSSFHTRNLHSKSNRLPRMVSTSSATRVVFFLFVVIELNPTFNPYADTYHDQWGNILPPDSPQYYGLEKVGAVFRYSDGSISLAEGYTWFRPSNGDQGYIMSNRQNDDGDWAKPTHYKTQAAFACSPLLPLLVVGTDPSVNSTFFRHGYSSAVCDKPTSTEGDGADKSWDLLHFCHPGESSRGISQASLGGSGRVYLAGKDADWMHALIPLPFHNTRQDITVPQATGLSGELPLVIALMAFWDHRHRKPGDVFSRNNGKWQQHRWTAHTPARGCKYSLSFRL